MLKTLTAAAFALSLALPAFADGPLESQMTAWLVGYDDAGEETLTQVEDVAPGALVEYRLAYTNVGDVPLSGLVVSAPVPEATDLEIESNETSVASIFEASIDDGDTWGVPPLEVAPGELADTGDYDLVRWSTSDEIAPGDSWEFVYRVSVE